MEKPLVEKFGLIIIESLHGNEKQNGKLLHEEILKYKTIEEPNLTIEYYDIQSKASLMEMLNKKVDEIISNNYFFMFHFETHGFNGGIEMKNKELVSWEELFPVFRKLNVFYRNYLVIYLGVCEGASMIKFIDPSDRAPFRGIVGSLRKIKSYDLLAGFERFYQHFFFSLDVEESLKAYNTGLEDKDSALQLIGCEYCFDQICDFERSTADLTKVKQLLCEDLTKKVFGFSYFSEKEQSRFIQREIEIISAECKSKRDFFLMLDLKQTGK